MVKVIPPEHIKISVSNDDFIGHLRRILEKNAREAIDERNAFIIAVSGGSCVNYFINAIKNLDADARLSQWVIYFCDERVVPEGDPDSTFGAYKAALAKEKDIPLTEEQFMKIKQGVTAAEAAVDYSRQIENFLPVDGIPDFDFLLLGLGPDGHTCSLFPGHKLLSEKSVNVAPITDSPKPPSSRITLTLPVLNSARCCVFAVAGEGKADVVKRILVDRDTSLPATLVNNSGHIWWILDKPAAKNLQN